MTGHFHCAYRHSHARCLYGTTNEVVISNKTWCWVCDRFPVHCQLPEGNKLNCTLAMYRHKTIPTSGPFDLHWCQSVTRQNRLLSQQPLLASSPTGTVCTCKQGLHLLYSWMLSSFTAWMSLSCAIRAWTFVRPSRPVISIFSIICCCLSIQYSQFSNTVSPTGCKILESSKTIRLAPAEGKEWFSISVDSNWAIANIFHTTHTTIFHLLLHYQVQTQAILGSVVQDWRILQTDDQIFFSTFIKDDRFCASNTFTIFKKHLELGAQLSWAYPVFYRYDGNWLILFILLPFFGEINCFVLAYNRE